MNRIAVRCRDAVRRIRSRALCPAVEGLEERKLLYSANGGHWYFPNRITYSFMPDGTSVAGTYSNLYQALDARAARNTWQDQFRKAAAIWQQVAGFNIVEVPDNGAPVDGTGLQQNDPRYGDIRIGGTPMNMGYLGYALLPPPVNGGSHAGDIVMNTSQLWKINNDYDLLSVAIHEFGHSLGMGHYDGVVADMNTYYALRQSLQPDDIAGIRSLYGAAPADPTPNIGWTSAIDLSSMIDPQGRMSYNAGYATDFGNAEWYKITVPSTIASPSTTTGKMKLTMQSSILSSLSPMMIILNSSRVEIARVYAQYVYGATVSLEILNVLPGQTYYILAKAAQAGPGQNGAFALQANFGTSAVAPIVPFNTAVASQPDQGVNGLMPLTTQKEMRRMQRRLRDGDGGVHDHENEDPGHDVIAVKLGNGRGMGYADAFLASPRRRHPRFPQPSRFRRHA